ncbi:hypothetical protein SNEBB_005871, partial [Seison nebaliae]
MSIKLTSDKFALIFCRKLPLSDADMPPYYS